MAVSGSDGRGEAGRILVFVPMYNCAPQIPRVIAQLRDPRVADLIDGVLCVDNRSTDGTPDATAAALADCPVRERRLLRNDANYGLGGSHKVAIEFARRNGYAHLVILHGDDQGSIADVVPLLEAGRHREVDFLMGARFMRGSRLVGYSRLRTAANVVFNRIFSAAAGRRIHDLGSGLNVFRVGAFDDGFHRRYADDLTFNYYLILGLIAQGRSVAFFPLVWREDDQVSNAKLTRMGLRMLGLLWRRVTARRAFLEGEHRQTPREAYPSTLIGSWSRSAAAVSS